MQNSDWYGRYFVLVPDIMGEDVKQNASANRAKEWAEYNGSEVDFVPEEIWAEIYEGINITNSIINADFTPPAAVEDDYNHILGQAHAMRGLAYFDLVRIFGQHYGYTADASHLGVPIVLEFDVTSKPARNTVAEVYSQIVSDLTTAIPLLYSFSETQDAGQISREAAQAILSRVYLYMEDYTNAIAQANAVINSGNFTLVDSAAYPTQFLDGKSSEAIFEIVFLQADNPGSDHLGGMYKESGYGDYLPAQDLLGMFDAGDVRGTMFLEDENLSGIYGSLRVNKYPSAGSMIATDNIPVVRLSEMYLIRAEAQAKLGGNDPAAQADIDMIRQRAWPAAPAVTATGQALVDEILRERRMELCFEGHRVFDMTRNNEDLVRVDCTAPPEACNIAAGNDRFILPIPDGERNANTDITQNPGY